MNTISAHILNLFSSTLPTLPSPKHSSNLGWWCHLWSFSHSVDHSLSIDLYVHPIMAFKLITMLIQLKPPTSHNYGIQRASTNMFDYGFQVCIVIPSMCVSELNWPRPGNIFQHSRNHALTVHRQPCLMTSSQFVRWWWPSESPNLLNIGCQMCH